MLKQVLIIIALVLALRLPFLTQAIQGDDVYYLAGAQYAQTDAAHPHHAQYLFQGRLVSMQGHPHPPLNTWILAGLLAAVGDIRETPFHAVYTLFSLIAALSMLSLARRYSPKPLLATMLFCAVPAFVVNGNSLEADLPFLAFWMLGMALFFEGVERRSQRLLLWAVPAFALAGLAAYQSVVALPILWWLIWQKQRNWKEAWLLSLTPAVVLLGWQLWELSVTGALPITVTAGYFSEYGLQRFQAKLLNAGALLGHLGWMVCPLLVLAVTRTPWALLALPLAYAVDLDLLYLLGVAAGISILAAAWRERSAWILIFFSAALVLFFAGSARYLLPLAAPLALLIAGQATARPAWLGAGIAANLALGLALAVSNAQHWAGYRDFVTQLAPDFASHRVWVNGEWGLRFYAESLGGLALAQGQALQPGDIILSSELGYPIPFTVGGGQLVPLTKSEIRPSLPLRLIGLRSKSGYSTAAAGLRPFDIVNAPADIVSAARVVERQPTLSYVPMGAAESGNHIVSGLYQVEDGKYRWAAGQARLLLKAPAQATPLHVVVYVPDSAPAREFTVELDGQIVATKRLSAPGLYTIDTPAVAPKGAQALLVIRCDKTFSAAGDTRELGFILQEAGFR